MEPRDNRILYAALAFFTAHLGGAVAGYQYGVNKQRLRALGSPESNNWDNPLMNALVGALFAPISSAMFGWGCGEQEQRIDYLQQAQIDRLTPMINQQYYGAADLEPQRGQQQWRDQVRTEQAELAEGIER